MMQMIKQNKINTNEQYSLFNLTILFVFAYVSSWKFVEIHAKYQRVNFITV